MEQDKSTTSIRIGDIISLRQPPSADVGEAGDASPDAWSGWLLGDGILNDSVVIVNKPPLFEDCTFQVGIRTRVTAAEELRNEEERMRKSTRVLSNEEKERQSELLTTFRNVARAEKEMNTKMMDDQMGSQIVYGQTIQLMHKKSGKFLTVSKDDTAISESENFRVYLADQASTLSWFTIQPAKAFQSDNEPVMNTNEAFLCVTDRDDEYLHISRHAFRQPDLLERESERRRFPALARKEVNSSLDKTPWKLCRFSETPAKAAVSDGHPPLNVGDVIYFRDPETRSYLQLDANQGTGLASFEKFSKWAEGDVEEIFHSSAYFVVEKGSEMEGGLIYWTEDVLLRHVNSGKYLSIGAEARLRIESRETATKFHFDYVEAVDGEKSPVLTAHALHLAADERCLSRKSSSVTMSAIEADAVALLICKETPAVYRRVSFGLSIAHLLDVLYNESGEKSTKRVLAVQDSDKLKSAKVLLRKLASFVCASADVDAWNVVTDPGKQKLLKEQNVLTNIIDIIDDCGDLDAKDGTRVKKTQAEKLHEQQLREACFVTLRVNLIGSPQNQSFIGDRFKVLLANVESGAVAMSCITEMLDNREIQTTRVNEKEIDIFIKMLRSDMKRVPRRLNATVLNVLAALCSCQGVAVETNQTRLSEKILDSNPDLLTMFEASTQGSIALQFPGESEPCVISPSSGGSLTDEQNSFLVSQLYLMAAMCVDRNYVAINKMINMISFDSVVACIKNVHLRDDVRSAFVKLAMCAFVDVEPQQNDRYKNLTICQSKLGKPETVRTPEVQITALQNVIAEHLQQDDWSGFTEHLVSTLYKLITFKFYNGSLSKLDAVMTTIADRLKEDTKDFTPIASANVSASASLKTGGSSKGVSARVHPDDGDGSDDDLPPPKKSCTDKWFDPDKRKRMIRALDHPFTMVFIIFLVFAAVAAGFIGPTDPDDPSYVYFFAFDMIAFVIFAVELVCRMWAVFNTYEFFMNPYSVMDFIVVMLDVVFFIPAVKNEMAGMGNSTKALRIVRLARLARLLKVIRLAKKLREEMMKEKEVPVWKLPGKFTNSKKDKLLSLTQMVRVLNRANDLSLRFRLRAVLKAMVNNRGGADATIITGLRDDSLPLKFSLQEKNLVSTLLHLIMYDYQPVVQSSVDLLMSMHTMQSELIEDLSNVQMLEYAQDESVYAALEEGIDQVTHEMDMFEVWADPEDPNHAETGETVRRQLRILTQQCQQESNLWPIGGDKFDPKLEVQTMLRNLEADVAYSKWREAMEFPEEGEDDEVAQLVRSLCLMINSFMVAFVRANLENQSKAFYLLPSLMRDVKINVPGAAELLFQILFDNEELMKLVPCDFIESLCDVLRTRRDAAVMRILTTMTQIKSVPIRENQIAIMLSLQADEDSEVFFVCEKPGSEQYLERTELMKKARRQPSQSEGPKESVIDDAHMIAGESEFVHLPAKLQYHVALLDLLASCAGGGINIVEAKIQKLYHTVHLLEAIVAEDTILEVKLSLSRVMFEAVIDVDVPVAGLCAQQLLWDWLLTFPASLDESVELLTQWKRRRLADPVHCRLTMCYIFDCVLPSITYFFRNYYRSSLANDRPEIAKFPDTLLAKTQKLLEICESLELPQASVARETKEQLQAHTRIKGLFSPKRKISQQTPDSPPTSPTAIVHQRKGGERRYSVTTMISEASEEKMKRDQTFRNEVDKLVKLDDVVDFTQREQKSLLSFLKQLPSVSELVESGLQAKIGILRYEPFLRKLVAHTRSQLEVRGDRKSLAQPYVHSTIWTMKLFREMIEHEWGFTYAERDEEGDDDSDEKVEKVQNALTEARAPQMCIDFIAKGLSHEVVNEATKLLMALLYREGGNQAVQQAVYEHFEESNSEFFFAQASDIMRLIAQWQSSADAGEAEDDDDASVPPQAQFLNALQLMCEGHFKPNQDIFREQMHNDHSINLLEDMVAHFITITKIGTRSAICTAQAFADLILEVIQGPCVGNQEYFAQGTELMETMNGMMRFRHDDEEDEEADEEVEEFKTTMLKIFKALLEGQNGKVSMIYERVLSVVHIEVLQLLLSPPPIDPDDEDISAEEQIELQEKAKAEPLKSVQVESLVLIQMLTGYQPKLTDELRLTDNVKSKMGSEVISVEIVWNGTLQQRFFHVPEMCQHLAKATRTSLVNTVERENSDLKLNDFVRKCKSIEAELNWQERLHQKGIAKFFSRNIQNSATWLTFYINCLINIIYLFNYEWVKKDDEYVEFEITNKTVEAIKTALNCIQITLSCFTLILFLVVRAPVYVNMAYKNTRSYTESFLAVFTTEVYTVYYMAYLIIAVAGYYMPLCNTFLLFDLLMKDPTTLAVLQSVWIPLPQLFATVILLGFTVYIFAHAIYLTASNHVPYDRCNELLRCFQLTLGHGLRNGGGMGDALDADVNAQLGPRFVIDMFFFMIVIIVLLNVVFGIIIDTFGALRETQREKDENILTMCFICSVDKSVFDKEGGRVYSEHIETEHNMWSYLKFMVYIWQQDQDDDDGLEQYVRQCIDSNNLEWFPVQTALRLEHLKEEGTSVLSMVKRMQDVFTTELAKVQSETTEKYGALSEEIAKLQAALQHESV